MQFQTLIDALEQRYPTQLAESWDQVGVHFGDAKAEVHRVMAVLDLDDTTLAEAIEKQVDTLIVHHPPLFFPIKRFDYSTPELRRYAQLIQHQIKVYAMHTNFDIAWDGMNDWLAAQLGLEQVESLTAGEQVGQPGIGRVGNLPTPLNRHDLIALLKQTYQRTELPIIEKAPRAQYQRIAILGGSGSEPAYVEAAIAQAADVYLTGDITYHRAQVCAQTDLMTVDIGHYAEAIFVTNMYKQLSEMAHTQSWPIEVVLSQSNTNPFQYE